MEGAISLIDTIVNIMFIIASIFLSYQMLMTTKAINQHTKNTNKYNIREKEKNKRAILAVKEIITDETFAFLHDNVTTPLITEVCKELTREGRNLKVSLLEVAQIKIFNETKNKVFYYPPKIGDPSNVGSLVLNLIPKDYNASGYCFCQNLNRVDLVNHGEHANYMLIKKCIVEYLDGRAPRTLENDQTPIKLPFDSNRKASLHISEVTVNLVDTLCDVKRVDSSKGVLTVGCELDFFYYKKITFDAEIVNIYNESYDCDIIIEARGNGMVAYTIPRDEQR